MKKALFQACALFAGATGAYAGGLDRSGQGVNILFEQGSVVQARLGYAIPDVSGSTADLINGGESQSGDITENFFTPGLAYKTALTEKLDFALIYDQPFGADVRYAEDYFLSQNLVPGGRADVLRAEADVDAVTALLRYKIGNGFSAIGGIRAQRLEAEVAVPIFSGYQIDQDADTDFGYVVGVAWEKPEIAARVSLTYNSKVTHDVSQTESFNSAPGGAVTTERTNSTIETPQSFNLDFQTGVAPKTLVFGSARWVDWPQTVYDPPVYRGLSNQDLVNYASPYWTFTLGVGRQFTDQFAGAFTVGYEPDSGDAVSNLGPTDGFWSVGLGGTYTIDKAEISGGIRYTDIGDATTTSGAEFSGNSAWAVGLQITYSLD